jgi:cytochrome d ubiquinol oxidase subunit II
MAYAWFAIVLLCLTMYVLLDGYDLGIGSLLLLERDPPRRREMVEIVATAWDGNETWVILLAVATWGGLPEAYGVLLPALFMPLIVMLVSLVLRGVSIEMISAADGVPRGWGLAFGAGSLTASFAQGVTIGGLLSGVTIRGGQFAGGAFDFLTPFSVLTGLATVLLYGVAGAAFLQLKTDGGLRAHAAATGRVLLGFLAVLTLFCAVSLDATATPVHIHSAARVTLFTILVVLAVGGFVLAWLGFGRGPDRRSLAGVVVAEIAGLLALVTLVAPILVPPGLTIQAAKSPGLTFLLLLIGVGLNVPLLLFYSWYAHHVFRGKYRVPDARRPAGMSASAQALHPKPSPQEVA